MDKMRNEHADIPMEYFKISGANNESTEVYSNIMEVNTFNS